MILAIALFVVLAVVCALIGFIRWKVEWLQLALILLACAAADAVFGAMLSLLRR